MDLDFVSSFHKTYDLPWGAGALAAQAAHASVAAIHTFRDHSDTQAYLSSLDTMHKIVLAASEKQLTDLCDVLCKNGVDHYAWTEQPENILTAIALRPCPREDVKPYIKHLSLLKALKEVN